MTVKNLIFFFLSVVKNYFLIKSSKLISCLIHVTCQINNGTFVLRQTVQMTKSLIWEVQPHYRFRIYFTLLRRRLLTTYFRFVYCKVYTLSLKCMIVFFIKFLLSHTVFLSTSDINRVGPTYCFCRVQCHFCVIFVDS